MLILFDHGTPVPLRQSLGGHSVVTAYELGWATLKNGALLQSAELAGYELLITTDKSWFISRIFRGAKSPSLLWARQTGRS